MSSSDGEWSLDHYTDTGLIGTGTMNQYASKFEDVLNQYFNEVMSGNGTPILDDSGNEYSPGNVTDWADTSGGSQYFTEVSNIYEKTMSLLKSADTTRAQEFKAFFSPSARMAAVGVINDMMAAQKSGEAKIGLGLYPDGTDMPIEDQVSEDEEQSAVNELAQKQKEAAQNLAEEGLRSVTGEPSANSVSFKEQCFITSRLVDIIDYREQTISKFKKIPYHPDAIQPNDFPSNASLMIHDDPFHFINRLLVYPDTAEYFNMTSAEIANLQPQIRFFKSMYDPEDKVEKNVEINFDTTFTNSAEVGTSGGSINSDLQSLLTDRNKRNAGVGIKKFDISFIGTDPFAAKKDLRAKLVIYAASFDELFKIRGLNKSLPYRYIDLALKTETVNNRKKGPTSGLPRSTIKKSDSNMTRAGSSTDDVNRLDFTIKAKIGIKPPMKTVAFNQNLMQALSRNSCTVQMSPVTHEFNFNDDGTVEFVIHYTPFMHDHYNTSMYDVFASSNRAVSDLNQKLANHVFDQNCDVEGKEKFRTDFIAKRKEEISAHMMHLINRLYRKQQIHYLTLPPSVVKLFNEKGPAADISEVFKSANSSWKYNIDGTKKTKDEIQQEAKIKDAADEAKNIVLKNSFGNPVTVSDNNIPFVYLHDIVDIALENIEKSLESNNLDKVINILAENTGMEASSDIFQNYRNSFREAGLKYKNLRVILGPVEVVDPGNPNKVRIVSLGDIPISLRYFQEFLTGEILSQGRTRFTLSAFLTRLIGRMLKSFLNNDTCFGGAVKHKLRVGKTEALCFNKDGTNDDISIALINARANALKAAGYKPKKTVKTKDFTSIPVVDRLMAQHVQQPVLQTSGIGSNDLLDNSGNKRQYLYMIFYAARTNAIDKYIGDKDDDVKRGCHHYKIGRDRGIVKTIKLNRDKRPMMKEVRFEAEGYDGLQQFKEVYNVSVDSYANFNVFPGTKIFVDPAGWAPNMTAEALASIGGSLNNLTDLGIGGYYDITKVEHSFGPGEFNTNFTAHWTNGIGKGAPPAGKSPSAPTNNKCKSVKKSEAGSAENKNTNAIRKGATAAPAFLKTLGTAVGLTESTIENVHTGVGDAIDEVSNIAKDIFFPYSSPGDS